MRHLQGKLDYLEDQVGQTDQAQRKTQTAEGLAEDNDLLQTQLEATRVVRQDTAHTPSRARTTSEDQHSRTRSDRHGCKRVSSRMLLVEGRRGSTDFATTSLNLRR